MAAYAFPADLLTSEGDLFRARLAELPPHLDTAHGAFAQVSRALWRDAWRTARRRRRRSGGTTTR
jgi:hypothetical protein